MSKLPDKIYVMADRAMEGYGIFTSTPHGQDIEYIRAETLQSERAEIVAALKAASRLAQNDYVEWPIAGGPNECAHGFSEGVACEKCDKGIVYSMLSKLEGGAK